MIQKEKIRVAVVIPKYGLIGGAEGFVAELTNRLAKDSRFEIHVLANQWQSCQSPVTFHKIPIISFPRWIRPVSFAYFAAKTIQKNRFDIVHSHERIFAMDLWSFHGIPHKTWIYRTKRNRLSLFDKATAWVEKKGMQNPCLKKLLPVSKLVETEVLDQYQIDRDKIQILHPGVTTKRFLHPDKAKWRSEIRTRYQFAKDDMILLFAGMNFELKGLATIISAMAALSADCNHLKLLVVGKGNQQRFKNLAFQKSVADRVVFAGVTQQIETYYAAADIFVLPSTFDTFGMVVLEAMTSGLPVIVANNVGARDLICHGKNGYIMSDSNAIDELSNILKPLSTDLKLCQEMGKLAQKTAMEHDWDKKADQVAQLYLQATSFPK